MFDGIIPEHLVCLKYSHLTKDVSESDGIVIELSVHKEACEPFDLYPFFSEQISDHVIQVFILAEKSVRTVINSECSLRLIENIRLG